MRAAAVRFEDQIRKRQRMAQLLCAQIGRGGNIGGPQPADDAHRSALRQLRRPSRARVSGRTGTHWPTLLHERRRAQIPAEGRLMFRAERPTGTSEEIYAELARQARGLFEGERDAIANAANLASLIYGVLADLNWAGFYFLKGGELVLGPF